MSSHVVPVLPVRRRYLMSALVAAPVRTRKHGLVPCWDFGVKAPFVGAQAGAADQAGIQRICDPHGQPVVRAVVVGVVAHGLSAALHAVGDEAQVLVVGRRKFEPLARDIGTQLLRAGIVAWGGTLAELHVGRPAAVVQDYGASPGISVVGIPGEHYVGTVALARSGFHPGPGFSLSEVDFQSPRPVRLHRHELPGSPVPQLRFRNGEHGLPGSYGLLRLMAGRDRKYDGCREQRKNPENQAFIHTLSRFC